MAAVVDRSIQCRADEISFPTEMIQGGGDVAPENHRPWKNYNRRRWNVPPANRSQLHPIASMKLRAGISESALLTVPLRLPETHAEFPLNPIPRRPTGGGSFSAPAPACVI